MPVFDAPVARPSQPVYGSQAWYDANPDEKHRKEFMDYYGLSDLNAQYAGSGDNWIVTKPGGANGDGSMSYERKQLIKAPAYDRSWVRPGMEQPQDEGSTDPGVFFGQPHSTAEQAAIDAITGRGSRYDEVTNPGTVEPSYYDIRRGVPGAGAFNFAPGDASAYGAGANGFLATQWDPSLRNVNYDTDTVEGRMARMLDEGNPYLRAAQSQALQSANNRGLLNSSLAVGAGTQAMMNTALPIAQQDAQSYLQQGMANQQYQNQAGQYNATTQNQLNQTGYQAFLGSTEADRQAQRQSELNMQTKQLEANTMLLDEDIKTRLAALQQDYAVELETLKQSYNTMINRDTQMGTMYSEALNSIAGFLNRAELTPERAQSGIKIIIDNLNAGLQFMAGIGAPQAVPAEGDIGPGFVPPVPSVG